MNMHICIYVLLHTCFYVEARIYIYKYMYRYMYTYIHIKSVPIGSVYHGSKKDAAVAQGVSGQLC